MRFAQLRLAPYGAFEDLTLDFDAGARLHVVYGTNGAGKSTTLEALRSVLYGFEPQSGNFRFARNSLRIGARLVRADGATLDFLRRTATKAPLWDPTDTTPIAAEELGPFLGNFDREQFMTLFGLDLVAMEKGGEDLLEGKGEIGRALFGAALGGERLARVFTQLDEELRALYVERGKNPRIALLRAEHKNVTSELRAASLSASAFERERRELQAAEAETSADLAALTSLRSERELLLALQRALVALRPLEDKLSELRALEALDVAGGTLLDVDSVQELRQLREEQLRIHESARERALRLEHVDEDARSIEARLAPALIARAEEVDALLERYGAFRAALDSLARSRVELDEARVKRREALGRLRLVSLDGDDSMAAADALEGRAADSSDALALAELHSARAQEAQRAALSERREVERAEARCVLALEAQANLETQLMEQLRVALEELAPFNGTLAELSALELPALGHEAERGARLEEARVKEAAAAQELAGLDAEVRLVQREVAALLAGKSKLPPTRAEVVAARAERDGLLREALDAAPAPSVVHRAGLAVGRADELIDRLAEDSERAAERLAIEQRVTRTETARSAAASALDRVTAERERAELDWAALWTHFGWTPRDRTDAKTWRERRRNILDRVREAQTRARDEVDETHSNLALRRADLVVAREAEVDAATRWAEWARAHGLDVDAGPAGARERLRAFDDLRHAVAAVARAERELSERRVIAERFSGDVRVLCQELSIQPVIADGRRADSDTHAELALAGAEALRAALDGARKAEADRASLERTREREARAAELAAARLEELGAQLSVFQARTGTESVEDCLASAQRAERRRQLLSEREALQNNFVKNAGGRDLEAVREAVGERTEEELQVEIEELNARLLALDERKVSRATKIALLTQKVEGVGRDDAARLDEQLASIEAQLEDATRSYLVAYLAQNVLRREVESYRRESQGPLLARAQELFRTLTSGAYTQLHASEDEKAKTIMVARRLDGTSVKVEGMSTGTQNQLYLALRIASVEHMLERAEPMPFVADDLFVNFDDERTEAALEVLAELGARTQVIVFTHHEEVVEAALRIEAAVDVIRLRSERDRTTVS